ncbi:MAG TPA: EAL domain-containing response regulator, partial [Acetobacteraceae bacterium]|nr:EAL domain-containing response regulator [Acetobacteraceae bacterium]
NSAEIYASHVYFRWHLPTYLVRQVHNSNGTPLPMMRLVVLDDDAATIEFVATVARRRGWHVDAVTQPPVFRALIKTTPPDAILLDLQLGASDGIEQLRFLDACNYRGSIVLMSGFDARVLASAQEIGDSLGLSIAAVIEKPARISRIERVLDAIEQSPAKPPIDAKPEAARPRAISPHDIDDAIASGQMALHLQPIVSASGAVERAEALIRWWDPMRGPVLPDAFIAVAESDGALMDRLTMWVAETAAQHYRRLADSGDPVQICVNISGCNLRDANFPDHMAALRERMSVPWGGIGLEITESVAMDDLDATASVLARLRLKGFAVAMDDFGTGHSSFIALRRMPFSTIKIDKSFVLDLLTSNDSLNIVRSVIQLAHDMRMSSVAEGVETADVARRLIELGIDALQGYYFSEPLPFESFVTWLQNHRASQNALPRPAGEG